jgi:sec-independent protein translocase protein TatA
MLRHSSLAYRMQLPLGFIGNLGSSEMLIIFIAILLLFGAKKIPELARGLGKSMGEFKKARDEFENEITRAEDEVKIRQVANKEVTPAAPKDPQE